jgi:hypothetical protein
VILYWQRHPVTLKLDCNDLLQIASMTMLELLLNLKINRSKSSNLMRRKEYAFMAGKITTDLFAFIKKFLIENSIIAKRKSWRSSYMNLSKALWEVIIKLELWNYSKFRVIHMKIQKIRREVIFAQSWLLRHIR